MDGPPGHADRIQTLTADGQARSYGIALYVVYWACWRCRSSRSWCRRWSITPTISRVCTFWRIPIAGLAGEIRRGVEIVALSGNGPDHPASRVGHVDLYRRASIPLSLSAAVRSVLLAVHAVVHRRFSCWPAASALFAYCYVVSLGFVNYLVGVGSAAGICRLDRALPRPRRPPRRRDRCSAWRYPSAITLHSSATCCA